MKKYHQRYGLGYEVIAQFIIPVLALLNNYENTTTAVELLAQLALLNELQTFVPIFNGNYLIFCGIKNRILYKIYKVYI